MFENSMLVYSIVALVLLSFGLIFSKFRTSYIKSLYDKINSQEEQLGKTINQLAASKTISRNLETTISEQGKQITEMATVNSKHTDKLSNAYLDNKQLIEDLKNATEAKSELEAKLGTIEASFDIQLESKVEELHRVEASYKKVSHSFEIMQKSNDNLREERDFYREEFMKLRENQSSSDSSNVSHIKSA